MNGMQILRIEAERIKRLRAVTLDLDGKNLVVVGKPDQGKTTALDLLWMAFKGKAVGPETISAGSDEARIEVILGDPERQYTITRKLSRDGDQAGRLTVKSSDGGKYGATFLDSILSDLSLDPTEFARAEGKRQVDILLKVVKLPGGVSIDGLDRDRAGLYEKRTAVNRDLDRLKAKLPAVEPEKIQEVSITEVLGGIESELSSLRSDNQDRIADLRNRNKDAMAAAKATNQANIAKRKKLADLRESREKLGKAAEDLEAKIRELQIELHRVQVALKEHDDSIAIGEPVIAGLVDIDEEALYNSLYATEVELGKQIETEEAPILARRTTAVTEAETQNKAAQLRKAWEQATEEVSKVKAESEGLTQQIAQVDAQKKSLLESVAWPIPGLSIRDGFVTFNDVILSQCGTSVRMQVSCAIAMALNPKLKAIRIDEGESLGAEGREAVFAWAAERGYQVLMSVVKDGPAADGELEIVDGALTNVAPAVTEETALAEAAS